jgi:hypothetical protein
MSRGAGKMQCVVLTALEEHGRMTVAVLHRRYLKRWPTDKERSVRHSITRALRGLEKLGKVKRGLDGLWLATEPRDREDRSETAHHEAGHAVIGLALQLPVALACIKPDSQGRSGYVAEAKAPSAIGYHYKKHGKSTRLVTKSKVTALDAFGNLPRKRELTPEEHRAEVVMCIAGPMAHAKLLGNINDWRIHASSSDMAIAGRHRSQLGDAGKSWKQYEDDAERLVNKHWPFIEAVAARLMKVDFVDAYQIDSICRRVVRRQHLKR